MQLVCESVSVSLIAYLYFFKKLHKDHVIRHSPFAVEMIFKSTQSVDNHFMYLQATIHWHKTVREKRQHHNIMRLHGNPFTVLQSSVQCH